MKVFNHKQLCIILKPSIDDELICYLIINQLRKHRFKHKQEKLLHNLSRYQCFYKNKGYNRFEILDIIKCNIFDCYSPDDNIYYYYKMKHSNNAYLTSRSLIQYVRGMYYLIDIFHRNNFDCYFIK